MDFASDPVLNNEKQSTTVYAITCHNAECRSDARAIPFISTAYIATHTMMKNPWNARANIPFM